ncbi:MAG: pantoate--beta-alanine ligase [Chromatiaceae bacterium]|nr:pantoate--beta-alanine ligase [Chromatiaceae bacterium]MCP5444159.1 pantoate--beta-alanine ligase [Chromatiaceae bacterium]
MITLHKIDQLRRQVALWRQAGQRIALVPTMGNLHTGHLRLVDRARQLADRVIATIFVNPLQFGQGEDFESYPRTLEDDSQKLEEYATDLLFAPAVSEVYQRPQTEQTIVRVPGLSDILCGQFRPGHFAGVATVVCKLFNMAQPDVAVFGEKDYQQLMVIRRMVEDLQIPVQIEGMATVREADGLAMSSRNGYLTVEERAKAPVVYQVLTQTAEALQAGDQDFKSLEESAWNSLENAGLRPDYFQIRRAQDLQSPDKEEKDLVILAAAYLGAARLIDNKTVTNR